MKLRSLLLVSCMLVVPSLAMFSHLIPADFRAACRRYGVAVTSGWPGNSGESHAIQPAPVAVQSAAQQPDAPLVTGQSVRVTPVSTLPAQTATALPFAATGGPPVSGGLLPIDEVPAATTNPAVPPLVAQLADRTRNVRDQQAREQLAIETQLKAVGRPVV